MKWSAICLGLMLAAEVLPAQQDSLMRDAVRLVTEGRGDSARTLVRRRLAVTSPADTLFPEALFTAGVVAADPDSAMRYFRRTSVEYAQSGWADRALLRIAQLSFAAGDVGGTYSSAQRVLTDYPFSRVRAQAAYWAGRAQIDLGNLPLACRYLTQAADSAADDVEISNRARFYVQRCAALPVANTPAVPPVDTARRDSASAARPPAATPPAATTFTVQIAAVRSVAAADQAMQNLKRAGYESRVTRDTDGFLKIRVGRFRTRPEAQRLATEIRGKLAASTPFVVEEP